MRSRSERWGYTTSWDRAVGLYFTLYYNWGLYYIIIFYIIILCVGTSHRSSTQLTGDLPCPSPGHRGESHHGVGVNFYLLRRESRPGRITRVCHKLGSAGRGHRATYSASIIASRGVLGRARAVGARASGHQQRRVGRVDVDAADTSSSPSRAARGSAEGAHEELQTRAPIRVIDQDRGHTSAHARAARRHSHSDCSSSRRADAQNAVVPEDRVPGLTIAP